MKHSDAQLLLARIGRNLYDGTPEQAALAAAAAALRFVHGIACHQGPVSIPAQTLLAKVEIKIEPATVILPPLKSIGGPSHAHAHALDKTSQAVDRADAGTGDNLA